MIINMNGAKAPETPSPVLQEKTVTPETLPTVIGADEGYDGLSQVTVNPDSQLKEENIRSGKTIFGVTGTFGDDILTLDDIVVKQFGYDNQNTYATIKSKREESTANVWMTNSMDSPFFTVLYGKGTDGTGNGDVKAIGFIEDYQNKRSAPTVIDYSFDEKTVTLIGTLALDPFHTRNYYKVTEYTYDIVYSIWLMSSTTAISGSALTELISNATYSQTLRSGDGASLSADIKIPATEGSLPAPGFASGTYTIQILVEIKSANITIREVS